MPVIDGFEEDFIKGGVVDLTFLITRNGDEDVRDII
jgi:hypothetical protein